MSRIKNYVDVKSEPVTSRSYEKLKMTRFDCRVYNSKGVVENKHLTWFDLYRLWKNGYDIPAFDVKDGVIRVHDVLCMSFSVKSLEFDIMALSNFRVNIVGNWGPAPYNLFLPLVKRGIFNPYFISTPKCFKRDPYIKRGTMYVRFDEYYANSVKLTSEEVDSLAEACNNRTLKNCKILPDGSPNMYSYARVIRAVDSDTTGIPYLYYCYFYKTHFGEFAIESPAGDVFSPAYCDLAEIAYFKDGFNFESDILEVNNWVADKMKDEEVIKVIMEKSLNPDRVKSKMKANSSKVKSVDPVIAGIKSCEFVTAEQAASMLGISKNSFDSLIDSNEVSIGSRIRGGVRYFSTSDLNLILEV